MQWENLREEEFENAVKISGGVCVVPIGCVEKHGQHLPVGTDVHIASTVALTAAEIEPVVVFPPVYFGDVFGHTVWRGGIMLSPELLLKLLSEMTSEIARNGFKKILFLNGHGGNANMLRFFVRSTQYSARDHVVMVRDADCGFELADLARELDEGKQYPELLPEDVAYIHQFLDSGRIDGHAGFFETAVEMYARGERVKPERMLAESGQPTHKTDYLRPTGILSSSRFWGIEFPNSYQGDHPEGVNERIGAAFVRRFAERQAEACRLLKQDDRILEWNDEWNKRSEWCQPKK
jgi:creatinine amidohydrolase